MLRDVHKWEDHRFGGHADYYYVDKLSKLEIISMSKEMNLYVEGYNFLWLDLTGEKKGLKDIRDNQDALDMVLSAYCTRSINVYARVSKIDDSSNLRGVITTRSEEENGMGKEDVALEEHVEEEVVKDDAPEGALLGEKNKERRERG